MSQSTGILLIVRSPDASPFQKEVPEDKPRIRHGIMDPLNVLNSVECGIDIMDTSYVYIVTERHSALIFDFKLNCEGNSERLACDGTGDAHTGSDRGYELSLSQER